MYLGVAAPVLILAYGVMMRLEEHVFTVLNLAVIFLMGAVPVDLPAVLTIVQSVGALELAKRGALVTRLDSIEDAASIDILCLDKTGTITQNKLSVADSMPFPGFTKENVVITAALASLIPGILLIVEGILVILMGMKYFHLEWEKLRTLVMLNLIFNSQFRVLIVRARRHFWSSIPGSELLLLSAATIISFALLGLYGIFVPSLTSYQILAVLAFSIIFALCIDFPKFYVFRRFKL